jgi:hypothetical protein
VQYSPNHDCLHEWVYNLADIDMQKVVWARDMGPEQNQELLRYYSTRRVWVLDADAIPPKLAPYSEVSQTAPKLAAISDPEIHTAPGNGVAK